MREAGTEEGVIRASSVRQTTGFALAKACKAYRANAAGFLSEFGLHPGQEMLLVELWSQDGLRASDLAGRLGVEPPTITKMVRRLERCGLVERRPDPKDARSFRVHLTGEGSSLEGPITRRWARAEEKTLAGMSAGERRTLHRLLTKVRSNLDTGFEQD